MLTAKNNQSRKKKKKRGGKEAGVVVRIQIIRKIEISVQIGECDSISLGQDTPLHSEFRLPKEQPYKVSLWVF